LKIIVALAKRFAKFLVSPRAMTNTNQIPNMTTTPIPANKIKAAIIECDNYIAKEQPRSESLRSQETKELLAFYISHRSNLIEMLKSAN